MTIIDDVLAQATGARFFRADLHIHSFGASHDVRDSDAHTLDSMGRNAASARKVTRYKMYSPSFEGLRVALEDADARVRIEDLVPQTVPRILGLHFDGGFLTGQVIQFNPTA
jgi:hypothetical protein